MFITGCTIGMSIYKWYRCWKQLLVINSTVVTHPTYCYQSSCSGPRQYNLQVRKNQTHGDFFAIDGPPRIFWKKNKRKKILWIQFQTFLNFPYPCLHSTIYIPVQLLAIHSSVYAFYLITCLRFILSLLTLWVNS